MKNLFKIVSRVLGLLIVAFVVFYFWASSPSLDENEYAKIIQNSDVLLENKDSIFSIATYNIGYLSGMTNNRPVPKPKELFDTNLEKVKKEIKNVSPDIIAFQEIDYDASRSYHINQEEEIAKLGYGFTARTINWDEHYLPFPYWPISMQFGKVISGQSIVSKFPLANQERIILSRVEDSPFYRDAFYLERLAQVVKANINGKEIVIINIHLEAFDKATRAKQFKEVEAIFNNYKDNYPTILLGDFNSRARDKNAVVQEFLSSGKIGNAAFIQNNIANTFDTKSPFQRIDYIFYTKEFIEYVSGRVLNEFEQASDHLPVYMKFKLK
ncbi:endonuclease/exonuclease/phosphatase family protein [Polaribacter dokdonensis]|uniref:Endonuclease/exonuclease/phosphatase family protein n=1 Tax=Polaribacter dokdonensis DSW-5 TaxID=1300348 RepID=A0A0N0UNB2_9FLAO|nr:endonuclease/exonuclease/phosphatase family protein [Polaribacter dokdonensis]KOY51140.1 Endonuclease/exonuclease/phosphatase family protein [Polaribacter dokdonensis DSW-5]SEE17778.1 Metal-dependent hydrolase, endonuclease/exonuclease/phosphatase family [Polaribacter dokdonensis DSW-5]